ncbi:MAG: hypothetical protein AB1Z23_02195 [Eubacteriales bacterium]
MPAVAHIGVGFAAKKFAKDIKVGYLILAAEAVELVFMGLWAGGIETPSSATGAGFYEYSHSIASGVVLSFLGALLTFLFSKNKKAALTIGLLVFSHTLLDFIASPKLAFYPYDTGMPLYPFSQIKIGLGVWKYGVLAQILEYGTLAGGILVYILTKIQMRKVKKEAAV